MRSFGRALGLVLAAALALGPGSRAASAQALPTLQPSFDCARAATEVEHAICGDNELAAADALMARLYAQAQVGAFGQGPSNQLAVQRKWLAERNQDCGDDQGPDRPTCLRGYYDRRNSDLAVAALFREPALALATLHRLRPGWAPLVEAVYRVAGEPPGTGWHAPAMAARRPRLLALLEPYARRFATDDRASYGRDILADLGIATAEDALASEVRFVAFVQIASAYAEDVSFPLFPCEAAVRHPGLLEASGAVFGSTLDNFVLSADCAETLPPTPLFDRLTERISATWPNCEGTIRFAAYRHYGLAVNEARIAIEPDLVGERLDAPMPRLRGVAVPTVNAAIRELGGYYRRYGRASAADATVLARAMVRRVMERGHDCGG